MLAASHRHAVVRSSWLFGLDGPNFVATMLRLAQERDAVRVVTDQVGCPTWTGHLAPALVGMLEREVSGLVHLAGGGHVSWNGFAEEIFRQADVCCSVEPAGSADMGRAAPRPQSAYRECGRFDHSPCRPGIAADRLRRQSRFRHRGRHELSGPGRR